MRERALRWETFALLALIAAGLACATGCGNGDDDGADDQPLGGAQCNNTCTTYPQSWQTSCPAGERCIEFRNSCPTAVVLSYQIGCNGDGRPGAPTCNCTQGPTLQSQQRAHWQIVDVDDSSTCVPKVAPPCLTSGLAVVVNDAAVGLDCTAGTRVEFTAGNQADDFGKFDTYNIDVEKDWYGIPLVFRPDLACAHDAGLDCRDLWCNAPQCPDAFITPTAGGCSDGRSPAAACQTTFGLFGQASGFVVEYCPSACATTGGACPSCQMSTACS